MIAASIRWSVYAGSTLFLAGAVAVALLGAIAKTLLTVLGIPTAYALVLLPAPSAVLGGVVWWAVVERRQAVDYLSGGAVGVLTVLLTVGIWTLLVALVYGHGVILIGETLLVIGIATGVTTSVGASALLPVIYARRRIHGDPSSGSGFAVD